MKRPEKTLVPLIAMVCLLAGCYTVEPVYSPASGGRFGAHVSPKSSWDVRGTVTDPAAAIDGDLGTAARSAFGQAGAELTLDLKETCLFQTIVIEHGYAQEEYCLSVAVSTSVDGKTFVDQYAAPGTRRLTIISLPEPVLARYVRLSVAAPGPGRWAVAEVFLQ